jgi:hypothetical protein
MPTPRPAQQIRHQEIVMLPILAERRALTERTRRGFDIAIARKIGGFFPVNCKTLCAALTRGRKDKTSGRLPIGLGWSYSVSSRTIQPGGNAGIRMPAVIHGNILARKSIEL